MGGLASVSDGDDCRHGVCNATAQHEATVLLAHRPKRAQSLAQARCSESWEDCRKTKCCNDPGLRCYEKDAHWGSCKPSCQPGIHMDDPPQYQIEWSCKDLSPSRFEMLGGFGCSNWQTAKMKDIETASPRDCEKECSATRGCTGFQWLSGSAPGCSGPHERKGACGLWREACQADYSNRGCSDWHQYQQIGTDSRTPEPEGYDIIVVGGGVVGSVVASELAEKLPEAKVLLLEAGKASHAKLGGSVPPSDWKNLVWPSVWTNYWSFFPSGDNQKPKFTKYDVPGNYMGMQSWSQTSGQQDTWGKKVPGYQCKILGGCGVMNGALHQIPNKAMFDEWPDGWKYDDMKQYYDEVERLFHITQKPSSDENHYLDDAGGEFVRNALRKAGWHETDSLDPHAWEMQVPHVSAKDGVRQSAASVFLPDALQKSNFELRLETEVLDIVKRGTRATGLKVKASSGAHETIKLKDKGLLIVSAGCLNTPRLLLKSGIDGRGTVGKGISDHNMRSTTYQFGGKKKGATPTTDVAKMGHDEDVVREYAETQTGPLTQFGPTFTAFFKSSQTAGPRNAMDVEMYMMPMSQSNKIDVSFALMRPTCSRANMEMRGDEAVWSHNQNSLGFDGCGGKDHDILWDAVGQMDRAMEKAGAWRTGDLGNVNAFNHWAGSCKLGSCADPETLLVKGTENVAVADASLLPGQV